MNKAYLDPLEYAYALQKKIRESETQIDDTIYDLGNKFLPIPVIIPWALLLFIFVDTAKLKK